MVMEDVNIKESSVKGKKGFVLFLQLFCRWKIVQN